jgi:DNA primase
MLADRTLAERIAERHGPIDFREPSYRALFQALLDADPADDLEQIAERLDVLPLRQLRELTNLSDVNDGMQADIGLSLDRLDARRLETRIDEIRSEIGSASTREAMDLLLRERLDLESELRRLLPIRSPRAKPKG